MPDTALPPAGEGEYYWKDLVGMEVVNAQGETIGRVAELFATAANDVIVVRDGAAEVLIPFVRKVVTHVDVQRRQIRVDWSLDG